MWEYQAACQAKINATILPIELSPCRSGQRNRAELFYIFPAMLVALAISVPKFFEIQADERWVDGLGLARLLNIEKRLCHQA